MTPAAAARSAAPGPGGGGVASLWTQAQICLNAGLGMTGPAKFSPKFRDRYGTVPWPHPVFYGSRLKHSKARD
eukprot:755360-Hanusia_phi.AAC.1